MLKGGNLRYEMAERSGAVGCGGLGVIHALCQQLGLVREIDEHLFLLKKHLPYHESDHVLNIAYKILVGGIRLEDIELRRQDENFLNGLGAQKIPDPTMAGDFTRRFSPEDILTLQECINRIRQRVEWIDRAIDLVKPHAGQITLRKDTDFSHTAQLDRWDDQGIKFMLGFDANPNLPVFGNPPNLLDEAGLLRRYFNKNHRFRRGLIPVSARGLSYTSFDPASQLFLERDDYRHAFGEHVVFSLFPGIASRFAQADLFAATKCLTYIWGTQSGSGNIDKIGSVNAASLVDSLHQPKVAFAQLHGSWFGDWNLRGAEPEPPHQLHSDGMLQSFFATEDYGLAVCWNLGGSISRFAQGYHLCDFQTSFYDYLADFLGQAIPAQRALQITAGILGDPTLRWPGVEPPTLRFNSRVGSEVTLKWTPASNPETCYCVLRSETEDGPFVELSNSPVNVPEIVDAPAPANVFYQVRTATLTHTGCGSFWNPSQSLKINVP